MFQYLENLRKKPEGARKRAVLTISISIVGIIFIIWAVTLSFRIKHTDFSWNTAKEGGSTIKETFSSFFGGMKDVLNNGSVLYEASTTPPESGSADSVFK